ncbi:MAG: ISL3 family transposase [Bacillota bacterium]
MLTQKDLFAKALLVEKPWFVHDIKFDQTAGKLEIWIDFERGSSFYYEDKELGIEGHFKAYDTTEKTWRHLNFFQYQCYLHAWIPRVELGNGKIRQVQAPWEGHAPGFTLLFEALILELVRVMPVHNVCQVLDVYDNKLWKMIKAYTNKARAEEDYSKVTVVGIDETSVRKNHVYVSLFVDIEEKRTIFVTEGKDHTVIQAFVSDLVAHGGQPDNIDQVSCDMSPAFIKGVEANLPSASVVFDRFHVSKVINEAVDKVRKSEVEKNPILKGSKYIFLKNRENLTAYQKQRLEGIQLSGLNLKTMKALNIREAFQQIYQAPTSEMFDKLLRKWYFWATHSRINPIKEAAYTIQRHWDGIVNWFDYKISNGILEGFNSIFQAAKAKARGYRRYDTIKAIIYLLTGKLDFSKINPHYVTHSK